MTRRPRSVGDVLEPELAEGGQSGRDKPLATLLLAQGDDQPAGAGPGVGEGLVQRLGVPDQRRQAGSRGSLAGREGVAVLLADSVSRSVGTDAPAHLGP